MKSIIFKNCAWGSTAFFLGFVSLFIFAVIADPHVSVGGSKPTCPHISFGNNLKITVTKRWGGNVVFFNQEAPYSGSIVSLGEDGVTVKNLDAPGIYFRLIKDPARTDNYWTLMFSFWYPISIFSILPLVALFKVRRKSKQT